MKPHYDDVLVNIARYVHSYNTWSDEALDTARLCLADSLGCALLALEFKECTKLLGPVISGTVVPKGSRVPGTSYLLDPIRAAFNIGTMIRWLDYNDTWLAAEWGHPSDNIGGLLAAADFLGNYTVKQLLENIIKAHEIQGCLALLNSFNRVGFDHVILVKIATAAVTAHMLGGDEERICAALSQAWADAGPLRTYRHAPNTVSRKSWAAGDATSRGLQLAWMTMQGETGIPTVLTAPKWGLYDVLFKGQPFAFQRAFGSYVMENVLFKISFPAEFHAQTAVEAAIILHEKVKGRWEEIESIDIETHESAIRIIDKKGPLNNPADRDHCLQYMIAIGLLFGTLTAEHYEQETAADPRIDALRSKMQVRENPQFSKDYLDPAKRSIANAITITMKDGSEYGPALVEYPVGHRRRREEAVPLLFDKFEANIGTRFDSKRTNQIVELFRDPDKLLETPLDTVMQLFTPAV